MDAKETIPPMTGQKVYYNIGHDDLVSFADRIINIYDGQIVEQTEL